MRVWKKKIISTSGVHLKKIKPTKATSKNVTKSVQELLPFMRLEKNYIVMKQGVMDIMKVHTRDLYTLTEEELQYILLTETRFLRSYTTAFKIIALNFPSRVATQRSYWQQKLAHTKEPIRIKFIERKLFEFDFLENERTNREFFLLYYADNIAQLEEMRELLQRSKQHSFPVELLTQQKKVDVLFLLNNMATKL